MTMSITGSAAIACVLASACLHALWNALLKKGRDPRLEATAVVTLCAVVTTVLTPLMVPTLFPGTRGALWAIASGIFEGIYFITLAQALQRAPLSVAYTIIRGGAMVLVWPVSVLLLGEPCTMLTAGGTVLVGLGLVAAQHTPAPPAAAPSAGAAAPMRLGSAYVCSVAVAGYHLCYDRALEGGMAPMALFSSAMWISLVITAVPLGRAGLSAMGRALRTDPGRLAMTALICTVSFVLFLSALRDAGAGVGITLRNTSVLFAQGMAWAIGERPHRWQLLGAVSVCTGAILVGLAH